jgi:opacity protein-like surface antigen
MIQVRALVLGIATAAAFGAAAHAADMPETWIPAQPRYVEMASGWYLRGDIGYRFNNVGSVEAPNAIVNSRYGDSVGVSAGGGYKYEWFRFDATVDYAPYITARAQSSLPGVSQPQYTVRLDALSLLANVYIDLGTWWGFTPYVGGGMGVTYLRGRDYTDTNPVVPVSHEVHNGRTNFSWAAMAGVAYWISPRWVVDLGYRHLELGDLPTTTGTNLAIDQTRWKSLSTDEIRLGFRFILD